MPGRPRKPTALHKADNTHRRDRTNQREPVFKIGPPSKPDHVLSRVEASREWDRIVPLLVEQRVISAAHAATVAAYCCAYADVVESEAIKAADGFAPYLEEIMIDGSGQEHRRLRPHPVIRMSQDAAKELRQWATQLGLTPASQAKVSSAPAPAEGDPFALYLANATPKTP